VKYADEDYEGATVPFDDAASVTTFVAAVAVASFEVPACSTESEDDGVQVGSTSSAAVAVDAEDVEGSAAADQAASDFPADAAAPLLAPPLARQPAPSPRSAAVPGPALSAAWVSWVFRTLQQFERFVQGNSAANATESL